jgi:hypothetical protein
MADELSDRIHDGDYGPVHFLTHVRLLSAIVANGEDVKSVLGLALEYTDQQDGGSREIKLAFPHEPADFGEVADLFAALAEQIRTNAP